MNLKVDSSLELPKRNPPSKHLDLGLMKPGAEDYLNYAVTRLLIYRTIT